MLYQIKSAETLDEIERGLKESASRHQFGVIAIHDLQDTLKNKLPVYGSQGHYTLATLCPTEMMKAFAEPRIEPVAREVEGVILQMMRAGGEA